jgi:pimeloyl-ACP methyl ester carboxylesterase
MSRPPFLDLPPGVRATKISTPAGPLAALRADADPAGRPPVLMVPGYTGSKEDFIAVLEPIVAAGHTVLAIDQRGQYESPGVDDPSAYDIDALAGDVRVAVEELGGGVHLVGHSFGGLVARAATLADPAAVRSLTLMDSGPGPVPPPADTNIGLMAQAVPQLDLETIWGLKRQIEAQTETDPPPADIEAWMHDRFVANHPAGLLRLAEQLLDVADRTDELTATGVPTLVLYGEDDDVWPPQLQAVMGARLGATVVALPAVGHSPAANAPGPTARALLEFWASH